MNYRLIVAWVTDDGVLPRTEVSDIIGCWNGINQGETRPAKQRGLSHQNILPTAHFTKSVFQNGWGLISQALPLSNSQCPTQPQCGSPRKATKARLIFSRGERNLPKKKYNERHPYTEYQNMLGNAYTSESRSLEGCVQVLSLLTYIPVKAKPSHCSRST